MITIRYNVDGKELSGEATDDLAFAKLVISEEKDSEVEVDNKTTMTVKKKEAVEPGETYFVKRCTTGMDAGHLFNPNSIWNKGGETKAFDTRSGRSVYRYEKVTKTCFDLYLRFLFSKNPAYLRNAEREIQ